LSVCIPHIFLLHLKRRPCESVISSIRGLIQTNGEAISSTPSKDPTAQVVQL
jgi:hypothetical protein